MEMSLSCLLFGFVMIQIAFVTQGSPSSGLYFMLNNTIYLPGDSVLITDIGAQLLEDRTVVGSTLVCVTTNVNTHCCRGSDGGAVGDYYYPNNSMVIRGNAIEIGTNTFSRYGYTEQVRLASVGNPLGPLGSYSCIVPDGLTGVDVSASINIYAATAIPTTPHLETTTPEITTPTVPVTTAPIPVVIITPSSNTATVGSEFNLNCSSDIMGSFIWNRSSSILLSGSGVTISDETSGSFSVLTISSVMTSHAGTYFCGVTAGGVSETKIINITVELSAPSVNVTSPTTILGSPLNLTCSISLVALLENDVQVEVIWIGPSGSILPEGTMLVGSGTFYISELTLNNLTVFDAGSIYTCSVYLNSSLPFVTSSFPVSSSSAISLQIPAPSSVTLSSSPAIIFVGSNFTLTCSIELLEEVAKSEIQVMWTGPGGSIPTGVPAGSGTLYTSTITVTAYNTSDDGNYYCTASRTSSRNFLIGSGSSANITIDIVYAPSSVNVSSSTTILFIGSSFTLTCFIELLEEVTNGVTLQVLWTRPSGSISTGTLTGHGTSYISNITVNAMDTSDNGNYTCIASLVPATVFLKKSATTRSSITIDIVALPTIYSSIKGFPTDNNFFTGLQLNLTCFINISHSVIEQINSTSVNAEWAKTGSSLVTDRRRTIVESYMVAALQYQTSLLFNSLDKSRDEGEYMCGLQVSIHHDGLNTFFWEMTLARTIMIPTIFFQLKISVISNCEDWKVINPLSKDMDIAANIVTLMLATCDCDFTSDHLTNRVFLCDSSSPQSVSYQAQLHGTLQANTSQLIAILQQWISSSTKLITVQLSLLNIDDLCIVSSDTQTPCDKQNANSTLGEHQGNNVGAIVGGIVMGLLALTAGVAAVIILILICARRRRYNLKNPPPDLIIPNTIPINFKSDNAEYEEIDKYQTSNFVKKHEDQTITTAKNPSYIASSYNESSMDNFTESGYVYIDVPSERR